MLASLITRLAVGVAGTAVVAAGTYIAKRAIDTALEDAYAAGKAEGQLDARAEAAEKLTAERLRATEERVAAWDQGYEFGSAEGARKARFDLRQELAAKLDAAWNERMAAVDAAYDAGIRRGRKEAVKEMQAELQAIRAQVDAFRATAEEALVATALTSYAAGYADGYDEGVRAGKAEATVGVNLLQGPPAGAKQVTVN